MQAPMDLFDAQVASQVEAESPLANRMRPKSLDDFVGQEHLLGRGRLLRRAIEADRITSLLFSGPPGTGKTTLAFIIANVTQSEFVKLNAVTSGVADLRKVVAEAIDRRKFYSRKTILFVDEIHRFNKAQQDALLPDVEAGRIILIGATTENPYYSVIAALVSRAQIFEFKELERADLETLLDRALKAKAGLGNYKIKIDDAAREHLINMSGGDARKVLNGLELVVLTTPQNAEGVIEVSLEAVSDSIQKKPVVYSQDTHHDVISAFIKSVRGSDPDAAIYWLAKMIYAGEDPLFIARRLVILASEDIGNADPQGIVVATSCLTTVQQIGMPEGRIALAQATVYLACAPKSNAAYMAINQALDDVKNGVDLKVPYYLKSNPIKSSKPVDDPGYQYPHAFPGHHVKQAYLPEKREYLKLSKLGYERVMGEYLSGLDSTIS